jgi:hypothetical protein
MPRLMPALGKVAELGHPPTVAELGATLGKPDRDVLLRGHVYLGLN